MNFLVRLLKTPSSFEADARGFVQNQTGHSWLVGGVGAWALPFALAQLGLSAAWTLPVLLAGYALWEAVQWRWYRAQAWDCFDDTAYVMIAACAVHYGLWWLVIVQMLFLRAGYLRRQNATPQPLQKETL